MVKKNDKVDIENIGKGILDNLGEINNMKQSNSTSVKEQKSISVNNDISKDTKQRSKRSYVLSDEAVQKLYELKLKWVKKDLSQIVEEAIIKYYEDNTL